MSPAAFVIRTRADCGRCVRQPMQLRTGSWCSVVCLTTRLGVGCLIGLRFLGNYCFGVGCRYFDGCIICGYRVSNGEIRRVIRATRR